MNKVSKLIILAAPSGSGKSTILRYLMQNPDLNLHFSISATTRQPRGTEKNGVEYLFITPDEFRQHIADGDFIEYEEVYTDRYYGTLRSQVDSQLEAGQNVIFDVDVKGALNIKKAYGKRALAIFIQPPSIDELRTRLMARATDSAEDIEQRLAKADYELTFAPQFDEVVINDNLEIAQIETETLVEDFLDD
ncbi:MAG: guanylate kinase [Bacteroidaceae bacterium]|nr:guanylate kinase [Bacteroidaceae bacterium]MBQ4380930.1 guanylate kinase [Bacteroidaceae bacterium]